MKGNRSFLTLMICAVTFISSCDKFSGDSLKGEESLKIISDKVYVPAMAGTTYLSLSSLIQASEPIKLQISAPPRYGELKEANGLLELTTTYISTKGDQFSFAVLSSNGSLLKEQKVDILNVARQEDLPCGSAIAFTDNFINVGTSGTITLDLLANDWICNGQLSDIAISIPDGPVYGGVIQVRQDNQVDYTIPSTSTTQKFDKFIYQILRRNDHSVLSQSVVYLNFDNTCFFSPGSGAYTMPLADASTLLFNPLSEAILCGNTIENVSVAITTQATFGTVAVNSAKQFTYTPSDLNKGNYGDLIVYQVCLPNGDCKKGWALFQFTGPGSCAERANDDVFAAFLPAATEPQTFDVLRNDCTTGEVTSLSIVGSPQFGTASVVAKNGATGGIINSNSPYQIHYRPNDSMTTDELTYRVCFSDGTCSQAKLYLKGTSF